MNYRLKISRAAEKDIDDLPGRLLDDLTQKHFPRIADNPRVFGRPKSGRLTGVWGY
jgi:mRNA-degrading endonuclease RelE of RelBE toxin-antitoxin system